MFAKSVLFPYTAVRGCQQLSFALIKGPIREEGVEVVVLKSVKKSSATIFYIAVKTIFKEYFYNININLEL